MIAEAMKSLLEATEKLSETYAKVVSQLPALESSSGSPLNIRLDIAVPEAFGSIERCHERISALIGLANSIAKLKSDQFVLVPKPLITSLPNSVLSVEKQLANLLARLEEVKSDGGLRDVIDHFVIQSVQQQAHPNVDLRQFYKDADNHVDQALQGANEILSIISPKNYDPFSGAMAGINALEIQLQSARKDVTLLLRDAKSKTTKIKTQEAQASEHLDSIEVLKGETEGQTRAFKAATEEHAKAAEDSNAKITALLTDVNETEKKATALKSQIDAYQSTFEAFQKKLDERNTIFQQGREEFEALRTTMLAASAENDKYIQQSKDALGWNTAKGLANSFAQSARELERPLLLSRVGFYLSIVLLFISAGVAFNGIPIIREYVEVPKFPVPGNGTEPGQIIALFAVLSIKVAVVLPALLFVGFASRRHKALFNQHQLYTYKKTVASALPGFKDHAEAHKEAMAAAAFARLLFNPQEDSSRDLASEAGSPGRLGRWLEKIVARSMKAVVAEGRDERR